MSDDSRSKVNLAILAPAQRPIKIEAVELYSSKLYAGTIFFVVLSNCILVTIRVSWLIVAPWEVVNMAWAIAARNQKFIPRMVTSLSPSEG